MNKLVLIDGFPNNGKTHLAEKILAADYGYRVIGTDGLYFEFIRDRQPDLFFPLLGHFIGPHYDALVEPASRDPRNITHPRNVAGQWANHLCETILQAAQQPRVAIEGYLLKCLDRNRVRGNPAYTLMEINVRQRRYFLRNDNSSESEVQPAVFA